MMKFLRRDVSRYSKLGKGRRKKQKWRGAKGRDNKIRLNMAGYPSAPAVGYKSKKSESGKINGFVPVLVRNANDLNKVGKESAAIISARIGAKKRLEIIKKADEMKIKILNLSKEVAK